MMSILLASKIPIDRWVEKAQRPGSRYPDAVLFHSAAFRAGKGKAAATGGAGGQTVRFRSGPERFPGCRALRRPAVMSKLISSSQRICRGSTLPSRRTVIQLPFCM